MLQVCFPHAAGHGGHSAPLADSWRQFSWLQFLLSAHADQRLLWMPGDSLITGEGSKSIPSHRIACSLASPSSQTTLGTPFSNRDHGLSLNLSLKDQCDMSHRTVGTGECGVCPCHQGPWTRMHGRGWGGGDSQNRAGPAHPSCTLRWKRSPRRMAHFMLPFYDPDLTRGLLLQPAPPAKCAAAAPPPSCPPHSSLPVSVLFPNNLSSTFRSFFFPASTYDKDM